MSEFFFILLFYLSISLISYSLLGTFLLTAPTKNVGYYGEQDQMILGRFFLFILFLYPSIELIFYFILGTLFVAQSYSLNEIEK